MRLEHKVAKGSKTTENLRKTKRSKGKTKRSKAKEKPQKSKEKQRKTKEKQRKSKIAMDPRTRLCSQTVCAFERV